MTVPAKTLLLALAVTLVVAWLGLFFSNRGVLVWGTGPDRDRKLGVLECQYFTGTGIVERQWVYSEFSKIGIGYDTCPRFVDLGK